MYERTRKNLKNAAAALLSQLAILVAGFLARKVFIVYLGTEVLGLSTTATSILDVLLLLEIGIWSAAAFTMYKPLYEGDQQKIKEIVALQGWLYKWIGIAIFVLSCIVMLFFPRIFSKSDLPVWYAYVTFGVLLYTCLLRFFVNYNRVVIYADQQDYKILFPMRVLDIFKLALQAFCVSRFENGFIWWAGLEVLASTGATIITNGIVYRNFPYTKEKVENPSGLLKKYPIVLQKAKFIAVHKVGYFVFQQMAPIMIYAFATLTTVALYGNYMLIVVNLSSLVFALEAGTGAGVGNLVAENNKELILKVFREYFTTKFFLVGVCGVCLWLLTEPFITVWIGPEFVLSRTTLALMIGSFAMLGLMSSIDSFLNAYGMFSDIWAPILQTVIGVSASILLGRQFGLNGVLAGILMADVIIRMGWKPVYLFRFGFKESYMKFALLLFKHVAMFIAPAALTVWVSGFIPIDASSGFLAFFEYAVCVFLLIFVSYGGVLLLFEKSSRGFLHRLIKAFNVRIGG